MTIEDIRRERATWPDPVDVMWDDNISCTNEPLHRLVYPDGRWQYVNDDYVFRCTDNAPDGCDELVNPYGDGLCPRHRAALAAMKE